MAVTIRTVTFDDLDARAAYELWRLRQQVFVVEQASPYPDLDGRDLEAATLHLLVEEGDELVGCLRLLDDGDQRRIGRLLVAQSSRGRGLASRLMEEAMSQCGDAEVRLDAQVGLRDFYAGYGFEVTGAEFDEDGVRHVPMRRPSVGR